MLRSMAGIGINVINWRTVVNRIATKNQEISERLEPEISCNYFAALTTMLEHLEEVNTLVDRYQEVINADVILLQRLEHRIMIRDLELQGIFIK